MNTQIISNAINGQGSDKPNLKPRNLNRESAKSPNEVSNLSLKENPSLYAKMITPKDIETSRVISQVTKSEAKHIPISSQLNQEINPTMENKSVNGGDRITI